MSKVTPASYRILLDSNGDETYATDLSPRATSIDWLNGMSDSDEKVARPNGMELTLLNDDGFLTSGIFGDFTTEEFIQTLANEQLTNGSFAAFTSNEPDSWTKHTYSAGMTVSQTAPGGGAGTGALHVTGTGDVSYAQSIDDNKEYEVTIVVSQFSGSGSITVWTYDSFELATSDLIETISAIGTYTFRMTVEDLTWFEVKVTRTSGTFTVTIDSVSVKEVIPQYGDFLEVQHEILGDDILTNGAFAAFTGNTPTCWTLQSATVSEAGSGEDHTGAGNGSVNFYETGVDLNAGITQIALDIGQQYRVDLYISYLATASKVEVNLGTTSRTLLTTGLHTFYRTADGTTLRLRAWSPSIASPVDATVDYISVKPVSFSTELIPVESGYSVVPDAVTTAQIQTKRGSLVKVLMSYAEIADEQLWIGKIENIVPTIGVDGDKTVKVTCVDPMKVFQEYDYVPRLQTNVTVDEAIATMLKRKPVFAFPYASYFWLIGAHGSSEVGKTTRLFSVPTNFEVGIQNIPFVGDNQNREDYLKSDIKGAATGGVNQLQFIKDLMAVEADGRFFWDGRSSQLVFHNRHHDLDTDIDAYIYGDEITGNTFIVADDLHNVITLHYQPREIGSPGSVLWTSPSVPILVRRRSHQNITLRYTDPNNPGVRIGAQDVLPMVQGVDWTISNTETGSIVTTKAFKAHAEVGASGATITLVNTKSRDQWVRSLQIRGTPLRTYAPTEITVRDPGSIRANDAQPMDVQALLISDRDDANAMAHYLMGRYRNAIRRFTQISIIAGLSDKNMRNAISLTVGSRISLTVDSANHTAQYIIVGERHIISPQSGIHNVTYILKPANRTAPWRLGVPGYSELGLTTALVY